MAERSPGVPETLVAAPGGPLLEQPLASGSDPTYVEPEVRLVGGLGVVAEVLVRVCAVAPCSGPYSRVEVFHDANGQVARLYHHGDLEQCSSPPSQYFEPDGTPGEIVAMFPVAPGSEEALAVLAVHSRNTEGLVSAGSLRTPCGPPQR